MTFRNVIIALKAIKFLYWVKYQPGVSKFVKVSAGVGKEYSLATLKPAYRNPYPIKNNTKFN